MEKQAEKIDENLAFFRFGRSFVLTYLCEGDKIK